MNNSGEEGIEYFDDIKAGELAVTVAERLENKGEIRGRSVLIQKQLNKKFGFISSVLERKLQDSRLDILDKFGESIFDFKNLIGLTQLKDNLLFLLTVNF